MKIALLAFLAITAQAACLWDAKDEKLYCAFDDPQPKWAIRCGPPTEPVRNEKGTVYCGRAVQNSERVIPVSTPEPRAQDLDLECEMVSTYSSTANTGKVRLRCKAVGR
jgi:hypothetical protein